ncbi:hypothetical protein L0F51_00340 [Afifella sp. H1R]|uniref:LamG-like jellyroll fold domain-containing protein n=1 Tax=Afifella sp. H1R TaxID=2908841 RepID=UPI001F457ED4|nr:LamG-like jellyroll fold domain-containing protein [Afifella sp. H1R]MCF1502212.1 hypothetical protein [Afifella sp. H1R]
MALNGAALTLMGGRRRGGANNFFGDLQSLGLDTGLVRCVDAGAAESYPGTGQTWADLSPAGNDLYLGSSSGADAADQAFTGTAGEVGPDTYFSSDGGDYFVEAAAVMTDWHKNNGLFSVAALIYYTGSNTIIVSSQGSVSQGVRLAIVSGILRLQCYNGSGLALDAQHPGTPTPNAWNFVAVGEDEAAETCRLCLNGANSSVAGTYTSPSASNPAIAMGAVGALNNGFLLAPAGTRFARLAMWDGVALSAADLSAIYAKQAELFTTLP